MANLTSPARIGVGAAVLNALALLLTGGLFVAALFMCRHQGDTARNVARWLKAALFFMSFFTFVYLIYSSVFVAYMTTNLSNVAVVIFSDISYCIQIIAKTVVLATLSSLARGILFARAGQRAKLGLPVAIVTYGLVVVNTILAIAYLGLVLWFNFSDSYLHIDEYEEMYLHVSRLMAVPMIFLFIGSLVALAFSALLFFKVHSKFPTLKMASIINVGSCFLFFVSSLYEIVYIGLHIPLSPKTQLYSDPPAAIPILLFFFSTMTAILPLVAITHLLRGKDKGLWTIKAGPGVPGAAFAPGPAAPQGQFQPMQQPMAQQAPGQAPQGQFAAYQPGMAPPSQAWQPTQPQQFHYGPQPQQQQFVPAQPPQQAYGQYPPPQAPSPVSQPTPPHEGSRQMSPPQEMSSHAHPSHVSSSYAHPSQVS